MPSCTSPSRPLATFLDSITLQEEGAASLGTDMTTGGYEDWSNGGKRPAVPAGDLQPSGS